MAPPLTPEQKAQAERLRSVTIKWDRAELDVRLGPPSGVYQLVGTWEPEEPCDIPTFRIEQDVAAAGAFYRNGLFVAINFPDVGAIANPGSEAMILFNSLRLEAINYTFPQGLKFFTMKRGDKLYIYSVAQVFAVRTEVSGGLEVYYNRRFGE